MMTKAGGGARDRRARGPREPATTGAGRGGSGGVLPPACRCRARGRGVLLLVLRAGDTSHARTEDGRSAGHHCNDTPPGVPTPAHPPRPTRRARAVEGGDGAAYYYEY